MWYSGPRLFLLGSLPDKYHYEYPADRFRLLGGVLQLQNDRLVQILLFILILPTVEDVWADLRIMRRDQLNTLYTPSGCCYSSFITARMPATHHRDSLLRVGLFLLS